jgi:hypothetical protein
MRVKSSNRRSIASVQLQLTELSGRKINGTGPFAEVCVTGNSNRDLRLFTGPPKGVK